MALLGNHNPTLGISSSRLKTLRRASTPWAWVLIASLIAGGVYFNGFGKKEFNLGTGEHPGVGQLESLVYVGMIDNKHLLASQNPITREDIDKSCAEGDAPESCYMPLSGNLIKTLTYCGTTYGLSVARLPFRRELPLIRSAPTLNLGEVEIQTMENPEGAAHCVVTYEDTLDHASPDYMAQALGWDATTGRHPYRYQSESRFFATIYIGGAEDKRLISKHRYLNYGDLATDCVDDCKQVAGDLTYNEIEAACARALAGGRAPTLEEASLVKKSSLKLDDNFGFWTSTRSDFDIVDANSNHIIPQYSRLGIVELDIDESRPRLAAICIAEVKE